MSLSICSISVASIKTGHLFQKQVIEKHINSFPYCPITNQPLSSSDLVEIKQYDGTYTRQDQSPISYLGKLQHEYNSLVLDIFNLRKCLRQTQQEITSSLYENEAANRVIAKFLKEKEDIEIQTQKLEARIEELKNKEG